MEMAIVWAKKPPFREEPTVLKHSGRFRSLEQEKEQKKGSSLALDLLLTISGEELLESGELLWEDGVEERSASSTYLGFWIDFFRRLFVGVRDSSSNSTSLGGAFFFLGKVWWW